ncbi:hypothetical protein GTV32_22905 [Gordonia sp. SID5947]|uniref:hypothetical protein n=1 Tax=Gordonia sp. SID5947 TaxID=2690315 RepID=UPI00136802AA|nr:hypothetical protein [Gordonia sp. SID5947]MYR08986.1 hypothetical protein [Gordonia sp. SID5947]
MNTHDPTAHLPGDPPERSWAYSQQGDGQRPATAAYSEPSPLNYYPDTDPTGTGSAPPTGGHTQRSEIPTERKHRSFDPGVDLTRYVGSAAFTAITAALVGYLGVLLINIVTTRWVPAAYWIEHALSRPALTASTAAWLSAAAAIVAAGIMWLLLKITNRTSMFFTAIAALVAAIGFVITYASGPWQATLGPAFLVAVVIAVIGVITTGYTRLSTTDPARY